MQEIFTTPDIIYHRLIKKFANKSINRDEIIEMCFDCEINYIKDADTMRTYIDAELKVDSISHQAIIPCNNSRILNVYDSDNNAINYSLSGANRIKVSEDYETIYMSYIGLFVDDDGTPMIRTSHIPALTTFCIKNIIEDDFLIDRAPYNKFILYDQKFSHQVTAIKQDWSHKDHEHHNKIDAIRFNMLPIAAQRGLLHKYYD